MAIAVIGGLMSSTLLSLVFVPAVFAVMDDIGKGVWRFFGRFVGATDEAEPASARPGRTAATLPRRRVRSAKLAPRLGAIARVAGGA